MNVRRVRKWCMVAALAARGQARRHLHTAESESSPSHSGTMGLLRIGSSAKLSRPLKQPRACSHERRHA